MSSPSSPAKFPGHASYPVTPSNNMRSRTSFPGESNVSPTSTSSDATYIPYTALRSVVSTPIARKVVIRSDPALVTCFDPSDKELYDLWVPKHKS